VPQIANKVHQLLFHFESGVVGSQGDAHAFSVP
jgi:hypothetical protein